MAMKILDVDLSELPDTIAVAEPYRSSLLLLRWRGVPLGWLQMDVEGDGVSGAKLWRALAA